MVEREWVKLDVIDLNGRQVGSIFEGMLGKGLHSFTWNAKTNASGQYIIRAVTEKSRYYEKTILLK